MMSKTEQVVIGFFGLIALGYMYGGMGIAIYEIAKAVINDQALSDFGVFSSSFLGILIVVNVAKAIAYNAHVITAFRTVIYGSMVCGAVVAVFSSSSIGSFELFFLGGASYSVAALIPLYATKRIAVHDAAMEEAEIANKMFGW